MTNNQNASQLQTYQAIMKDDGSVAFAISPPGVKIATSSEAGRIDLTPEGFETLRQLSQDGPITTEALLGLEHKEEPQSSKAT